MSASLLLTPRKAFGKRQTLMPLSPRVSSKRALFPKNAADDSDSTLDGMSPLSTSSYSSSMSSPEHYDSPVVAPDIPRRSQRNSRTRIRKILEECRGPCKILEECRGMPKFPITNTNNQDMPLPNSPRRSPRILKQNEMASPPKFLEIVAETPMKNSPRMKTLLKAFRKRDTVETPSENENFIIEESPDRMSLNETSPTKTVEKQRNKDVDDKPRVVESQKLPSAQLIISVQNFYKPKDVSLPDFSSNRGRLMTFFGGVKRGRSPSLDSIHSFRSISSVAGSRRSSINRGKRHKVGEINCGVRHRIRKPRPKKKPTKFEMKKFTPFRPKMTPVDRINSYLDSVGLKSPNERKSHTKLSKAKNENPPRNFETFTEVGSQSPPPNPARKFFKTNRTIGVNRTTTVTVDKYMKLQVRNGKFKLDKPRTERRTRVLKEAQPQLECEAPAAFDLADSEEVNDNSIRNKVEGILNNLSMDQNLMNPEDVLLFQSAKDTVSPVGRVEIGDIQTPQGLPNLASGKENEDQKMFPVFCPGQTNAITKVAKKPKSKKRHLPTMGLDQYQIDAGQKTFGVTQCSECHLVYELGNPEEEITHLNYHNNTHVLKFQGWKQERVVGRYDNGRVILVNPGDSKAWLNKAKEVVGVVDQDLGYVDEGLTSISSKMVFLYILDKTVVGCLVAEPINSASRMLELEVDMNVCSMETYPIKCGVNRVWALVTNRREGIATRLVDCMRSHFMYGHILGIDEIAFSGPTVAGKAFAAKYTSTNQFYVYD